MMNDDLISRSAIKKFIQDGLNNKTFGHDAIEIMTEIEYAPAVDVMGVEEPELRILIDALDHRIWKMEDQGRDLLNKHMFNKLVQLRNKLAVFGAEHFGKMEG